MVKRASRNGFTLLEILVSTAIFVVLMGMVYTIFSGALNYWRRGYTLASRQQAARTVFSRMTSDVSSLFLSIPRSIYCFGTKEKFYFISASAIGSEGHLAEMGYEYVPSDKKIIFSYQDTADFDFATFDSQKTIAISILGLSFSYLNKEGVWVEDWDSRISGAQEKTPPQAVRIILEIENKDYADNKEVFETVVELPIRSKYQ